MPMPRRVRTTILLLVVVWAVAAFVLPSPRNPDVTDPAARIDRHTNAPGDITALFAASCFDCHSYETDWPWYTNVFPGSLLLRSHVRDGRAEMNLSEWAH